MGLSPVVGKWASVSQQEYCARAVAHICDPARYVNRPPDCDKQLCDTAVRLSPRKLPVVLIHDP